MKGGGGLFYLDKQFINAQKNRQNTVCQKEHLKLESKAGNNKKKTCSVDSGRQGVAINKSCIYVSQKEHPIKLKWLKTTR